MVPATRLKPQRSPVSLLRHATRLRPKGWLCGVRGSLPLGSRHGRCCAGVPVAPCSCWRDRSTATDRCISSAVLAAPRLPHHRAVDGGHHGLVLAPAGEMNLVIATFPKPRRPSGSPLVSACHAESVTRCSLGVAESARRDRPRTGSRRQRRRLGVAWHTSHPWCFH